MSFKLQPFLFKDMLRISLLLWGLSVSSVTAYEMPKSWMWYQTPPVTVAPEKPQTPPPSLTAHASSIEDLTPAERRSRALGRRFEHQVAVALETPTFENVQAAQRTQRYILHRADRFQQRWQQVSLLDPESYAPDENPNTSYRNLEKSLRKTTRDQKIKALSREWGLFFLFKKGCPYCDQFAPHVKRLATVYGFEVKAISADGGSLDLFPGATQDNGSIAALNPRGVYPALLLAHPPSGSVIPVSWGLTSYDPLLDNFEIVVQTLEASS